MDLIKYKGQVYKRVDEAIDENMPISKMSDEQVSKIAIYAKTKTEDLVRSERNINSVGFPNTQESKRLTEEFWKGVDTLKKYGELTPKTAKKYPTLTPAKLLELVKHLEALPSHIATLERENTKNANEFLASPHGQQEALALEKTIGSLLAKYKELYATTEKAYSNLPKAITQNGSEGQRTITTYMQEIMKSAGHIVGSLHYIKELIETDIKK